VLPQLDQVYDALFVAVRSGSWAAAEELKSHPTLTIFEMPAPGWGRYLVLQRALVAGAAYIHAVDLDMLVHWVERMVGGPRPLPGSTSRVFDYRPHGPGIRRVRKPSSKRSTSSTGFSHRVRDGF
jgi:hypothetical protein